MLKVTALQRHGYSYLYSINGEHPNQLYNIFRPLVSAILVDATDANSCFRNEHCVLSERNPHGIPAWNIFSFHFWNSVRYSTQHKHIINASR